MEGEIVSRSTLLVYTLVIALIIFVFFVARFGAIFQPPCWQATVNGMNDIRDNLDKRGFDSTLPVFNGCTYSVFFTNDKGRCMELCQGFDQEGDCLDKCQACMREDHNSQIVAVADLEFGEWIKFWQKKPTIYCVGTKYTWEAGGYSEGDVLRLGPPAGDEADDNNMGNLYCLNFEKIGESGYLISLRDKPPAQGTVDELKDFMKQC